MQNIPKVLVFDVIDTLLDNTQTHLSIAKLLNGRVDLASTWFTTMLHYTLVDSLCDRYNTFSDVCKATFEMIASSHHISYEQSALRDALEHILTSPAHSDVPPALQRLQEAGFTIVALTNSSSNALNTMLTHAGIRHHFHECISVEEVQRYKPHLATYQYVIDKYNIESHDLMMIAAHGWDIVGAQQAGMQTAFIMRENQAIYPLAAPPTHCVHHLGELADLFSR